MDVNEISAGTFDQTMFEQYNGFLVALLFLLAGGGYAVAAPSVQLQVEDPVIVKEGSFEATVRIVNNSDEEISVRVPSQIEAGIDVSNGGGTVETSLPGSDGTENRTIGAKQFIGKTVQVSTKKSWDRPVKLNVSWKHGDLSSSSSATAYYFPERIAKINVKGYGPLYLAFFYQDAPRNIYHVMQLIRTESFYDGTTFHRLIKGFLLQGGAQDPASDTSYEVAPEPNDRKHKFGTVSLAHGRRSKMNGTQFFVTLGRQPYLDGQYTAIGQVKEESHSVLNQIEQQVKTDHDKLGGQCGVDHTDAPQNPLVMESVQLLTPSEYEKQSNDQSNGSTEGGQEGGNGASTNNNPLKSGSSSDGQGQ